MKAALIALMATGIGLLVKELKAWHDERMERKRRERRSATKTD